MIIDNVPIGSTIASIGYEVVTGPGTNEVFGNEAEAVRAALNAWAADTDPGPVPAPTITQRWAMRCPHGEVVDVAVRVEPIAPGATLNVPDRATRRDRRDEVLSLMDQMAGRDPTTGLDSRPPVEVEYTHTCRHCPKPLRRIAAGWVDPDGFMRCQKDLDHVPLP